jgi:predicted nucleic acid-binding protein
MDAYLAAFAIADGLTLVTTDDAFDAFKPLGLDLLHVDTRDRSRQRS